MDIKGVPSAWRIAKVAPSFKKKKKKIKKNLGICRPVSFTLALEKIMEQVCSELISGHMQKRGVTGISQNGFTKGKSCMIAL